GKQGKRERKSGTHRDIVLSPAALVQAAGLRSTVAPGHTGAVPTWRAALCLCSGIALAVCAARCGGAASSSHGPDGGSPDAATDAGGDAGSDAGSVGALMPSVNPGGPSCTPPRACPPLLPADGGACGPDAMTC